MDFEAPAKDLGFSENLLRDAVDHGMSFWRSHEGKGRRQKFVRKDDFKFLEVRNRKYYRGDEKGEEGSESEKEEEENEEDDYEPPIFQPRNGKYLAFIEDSPTLILRQLYLFKNLLLFRINV